MKKLIITAVFAFAFFTVKAQSEVAPAADKAPEVAPQVQVEVVDPSIVEEVPAVEVQITETPAATADQTPAKPCCKGKSANGTAGASSCQKKCKKDAAAAAPANNSGTTPAAEKKACCGSANKPCCKAKK